MRGSACARPASGLNLLAFWTSGTTRRAKEINVTACIWEGLGPRLLRFALLALYGIPSLPATARAEGPVRVHQVTIAVTSAIDGRPPSGVRVKLEGKGVGTSRVSQPSYGDSLLLTSYSGLELEASGRLVFTVVPGSYIVTVTHESHQTRAFRIEVPPPGEEGATSHEYPVLLERNEKLLDWNLYVTVLGPPRDAPRAPAQPLEGAYVRTYHVESGLRAGGTSTKANGVVHIQSNFTIGDLVKVEVTKDGYRRAEQTVTIGSRQDTGGNPALTHRTTVADYLTVTLEPVDDERAPALIIEAVRTDNGAPVPGATVNIDVIGGANVAAAVTDAQGRTPPLTLFARNVANEIHAGYRAKVIAEGYEQAWSDIPPDMIQPGEPKAYAVHLEPKAKPASAGAGFRLTEIRVEPQLTTPMPPQIVDAGQRAFTIEGSAPNLDAKGQMTVEVPPTVAADDTPITITARSSAEWRIKAPFFLWLNTGINVLGRGENKTNGTEYQAVGTSTVACEQTVQTTFGKDEFVRKWEENGVRYRQYTIGFYAAGTAYGIAVKFTYRSGS